MKPRYKKSLYLLVAAAVVTSTAVADEKESVFQWNTVFNNNDLMPSAQGRTFNSYNPPSVNTRGMVVVRARSRGGPPLGPATHGIYMRDMEQADSEIVRVLDRTTLVPEPNNLGTTFVETPSFPRIDMHSDTIATRGNHQPVHRYYEPDGTETRAGTTGIYTNPYGDLITGAAKLGHVPDYGFFGVPDYNGVTFEVFPGAPTITNDSGLGCWVSGPSSFTDVIAADYWAAGTFAGVPTAAWSANLSYAGVGGPYGKNWDNLFVWPVRGGQ